MKRTVWFGLSVLALSSQGAFAQPADAGATLKKLVQPIIGTSRI